MKYIKYQLSQDVKYSGAIYIIHPTTKGQIPRHGATMRHIEHWQEHKFGEGENLRWRYIRMIALIMRASPGWAKSHRQRNKEMHILHGNIAEEVVRKILKAFEDQDTVNKREAEKEDDKQLRRRGVDILAKRDADALTKLVRAKTGKELRDAVQELANQDRDRPVYMSSKYKESQEKKRKKDKEAAAAVGGSSSSNTPWKAKAAVNFMKALDQNMWEVDVVETEEELQKASGIYWATDSERDDLLRTAYANKCRHRAAVVCEEQSKTFPGEAMEIPIKDGNKTYFKKGYIWQIGVGADIKPKKIRRLATEQVTDRVATVCVQLLPEEMAGHEGHGQFKKVAEKYGLKSKEAEEFIRAVITKTVKTEIYAVYSIAKFGNKGTEHYSALAKVEADKAEKLVDTSGENGYVFNPFFGSDVEAVRKAKEEFEYILTGCQTIKAVKDIVKGHPEARGIMYTQGKLFIRVPVEKAGLLRKELLGLDKPSPGKKFYMENAPDFTPAQLQTLCKTGLGWEIEISGNPFYRGGMKIWKVLAEGQPEVKEFVMEGRLVKITPGDDKTGRWRPAVERKETSEQNPTGSKRKSQSGEPAVLGQEMALEDAAGVADEEMKEVAAAAERRQQQRGSSPKAWQEEVELRIKQIELGGNRLGDQVNNLQAVVQTQNTKMEELGSAVAAQQTQVAAMEGVTRDISNRMCTEENMRTMLREFLQQQSEGPRSAGQ
jgi:hypothetical protein